jgi:hypothetical protein
MAEQNISGSSGGNIGMAALKAKMKWQRNGNQ